MFFHLHADISVFISVKYSESLPGMQSVSPTPKDLEINFLKQLLTPSQSQDTSPNDKVETIIIIGATSVYLFQASICLQNSAENLDSQIFQQI